MINMIKFCSEIRIVKLVYCSESITSHKCWRKKKDKNSWRKKKDGKALGETDMHLCAHMHKCIYVHVLISAQSIMCV